MDAITRHLSSVFMPIVEANVVPDVLVRAGIRSLLDGMLRSLDARDHEANVAAKLAYVQDLKQRGIAESTAAANEQHYEVPAAFYDSCMGIHKKYSCGYWPRGDSMSLSESEEAALELVVERARLDEEGITRVLDMGCGWGSATLYIAARFPKINVTSVSNSNSQREFIMQQAKLRGLTNVEVITSDINDFEAPHAGSFDRVISIEMMEHVKNYEALLEKVSRWLSPTGLFFVHIFTHKTLPFHYTEGWMAENFFSGGQMPSDDLLLYFQRDLAIEGHWWLNGKHYQKTCEAWLAKFDANKQAALAAIDSCYGPADRIKWFVKWRLFFIACAELFGHRGGDEWGVSHYLFSNKNAQTSAATKRKARAQ